MKQTILLFAAAFLSGYLILSAVRNPPQVDAASEQKSSARSATSTRVDQVFGEYEALMFDEEEKEQLLLDQANTLSGLVGLVEKLDAERGSSNNFDRLNPVALKLAKLFPAQALDYYATCPSNASMNAHMVGEIREKWATLDLTACLAKLDQNETLSTRDFCNLWNEMVRRNVPDKAIEHTRAFAKLDTKKQWAIMEGFYTSDAATVALLVPVIKDPEVMKKAREILDDASKQVPADPNKKSDYDIEKEKRDALAKQLKEDKPEPGQLVEILEGEKSESDRKAILSAVFEPQEDEKQNATLWLARISGLLAVIKDLPDNPPIDPGRKGDFLHKDELEEWLPQQSPRLQRAWADDLIRYKNNAEALEWIEQLGTASLRADMRELVVKNWTYSNPQEAAGYLVREVAVEQEDMLPEAVYKWALQDYAAARQWLDALPDSPAKVAALQKLEKKAKP